MSVEECVKSGLPPEWCAHCRAKAQAKREPAPEEKYRRQPMYARFHGKCVACPDDIEPGDLMVYDEEYGRWIHAGCGGS